MRFYLGTHRESWLARTDVPLFISHRRLARRRTLPRALGRWALDSGGFTELSMHGRWQTSPETYIAAVRRYRDEIGGLDWAAPQDWMCEPHMLTKTGLTVLEHQQRTITSVLNLRAQAPDLPIIPVLQGWTPDDYLDHVDQYTAAGLDLTTEPTVGLGSVCRRQATGQIAHLVRTLASLGLRLHGFGMKLGAFTGTDVAANLTSADSLAWSYRARNDQPLPGCTHRTCANCIRYAHHWRTRLLARVDTRQLTLEMAS